MGGKGGKGSHRTCEICGVKERHTSGELMFSQFPLEVNRCKSWLRAVGNEELVHLPIEKLHQLRSVCAIHFQRKDFNKKGNRLKKRAIPMLNLNAVPLSDTQLIGFPQYMWKNRNVGVLQGPSTSNQAQLSTNVGVLQGQEVGISSVLNAGAAARGVRVSSERALMPDCIDFTDSKCAKQAGQPRHVLFPCIV